MNKLLIIEDDPIIAHIYESRLEKEGYEVEVASDGQSGFYRIHEFRPDAVLLDLMLPKLNGVEILKKIRAQSQFQHIPIIVFTNAYVPNMIQESFSAGATQVFNKATLTPRQIIDALQNAIALTGNSAQGASTATAQPPGADNGAQTSFQSSITETFSDAPFHGEQPPPAPAAADNSPAAAPPPAGAPPALAASSSGATTPSVVPPPQPAPGATATPTSAPNSVPADQPAPAATPNAEANATPVPDAEKDAAATDKAFQADLLKTFVDSAPETLMGIRKSLQEFSKAQDDATRQGPLLELFRKVHALTGSAGIAGLHPISKMAAALEVLLKELYEKPKNLNASTLRTVANSVDFISELFNNHLDPNYEDSDPVNILVVDDEILSRRAITYALEKAGLKSVSVEDPQVALNLATETSFSLIFLDVQMPGMDGFDLCTKIRALPNNKTTPVIFVTSLTDFKSRARSTLSGGTDLIAKPFMFIELSVKALTYVLRAQVARREEHRCAA